MGHARHLLYFSLTDREPGGRHVVQLLQDAPRQLALEGRTLDSDPIPPRLDRDPHLAFERPEVSVALPVESLGDGVVLKNQRIFVCQPNLAAVWG